MKKIIGQTMGDFVITNVYGHNEVEIVCQHCAGQRVIGYNQNIKVCKCQNTLKYKYVLKKITIIINYIFVKDQDKHTSYVLDHIKNIVHD